MQCIYVQGFIYLIWILHKTAAQDVTLSSNGTNGATLLQANALTLTCAVSQNVVAVLWFKTESTNLAFERKVTAIGRLTNGSCGYDPQPPAGFTCACVSASNYVCTIQSITTEDHGDIWRCRAIGSTNYSGYLTINVNVRVSSAMLTPDVDIISVIAGTSTQLQCASTAIPAPTIKWFKISGFLDATPMDITFQSSYTSTQMGTTSTLSLTPSKGDHGWRVYCTAENLGKNVTSDKKPSLNVLYDPSLPECTYRGQKEIGPIHIIKESTFIISCTSDGNPPPEYTWTYPTSQSYTGQNLTINSIQTSNRGSFTVQARNTMIATGSTTGVPATKTSTILVDVLYGPSIPTFSVGNTHVTGTVKIISGNNRTIRCSSQSNPPPTYTWTSGGTDNNPELVLTNVQHPASDGQYTCKVETTMNPTRDKSQTEKQNGSVTVEVLYPPSTPEFHYSSIDGPTIIGNVLAVVQGESPPVYCVSMANPIVSSYMWSGPRGSASQQLVINSINENSTRTCTATNNMVETCGSDANCGETKTGTKHDNLTVIVWKPPVTPSIAYHPHCNTNVSMSAPQTLKVIEGDSFCLRCLSSSSPGPTYSWSGQASTSTAVQSITNVTRNAVKINACRAENKMITTFNGTVVRSKESSVNLEVLYAPRVEAMSDRQVVKGERFSYECPFTPGNPNTTTFAWTPSGTTMSSSGILTILSVERSDDKIYTCNVSNDLIPTDNTASQKGWHSRQFHLEVLYGADNMNFSTDQWPSRTSLNVSEKTSVVMNCTLESNPGSHMNISKSGQVINTMTNTKMLSYRTDGKCDDAGIYTCMGQNQYPGSQSQSIDLKVLCSPRYALGDGPKNVSSKQHETATLKLAIQAYPAPAHRWAKCLNGTCSEIQSSTRFNVSSDGLNAHLTVVNVELADFGQYQLTALNGVGNLTEVFWLIPSDKPEIPKNFSYVPSSVTQTSVTLTWIPGFNGGPPQTFHIQYKKSLDNEWHIQSVPQTEKPTLMNITVVNLSPATQYEARMNATNTIGSSKYTESLTILTSKAEVPPSSVALIAGIVVGAIAAIAIVIGVVVFLKRRKGKGVNKDMTDKHLMKSVHGVQQRFDENDIPDEVENQMYIPAGKVTRPGVKDAESTNPNAAVYSTPNKVKKGAKPADDSNLYAVVNKEAAKGKGNKKTTPKKKDKQKQEKVKEATGKDNPAYDDSTTYENHEMPFKPNVNKDGLIYADLDFPNEPKGQKRLVIHGLDNMTEYADVDLTKTADPLPDSDGEDKNTTK